MKRRLVLTFMLIAGTLALASAHVDGVAQTRSRLLAPNSCPPPGAPSSFWGYITLNGAPPPAGMAVAAWVNGVEVANTTTQASGGSAYFLIDVPERAYDSLTGQVCRQGGAPGETVSFVLCSNVTANETGVWNGGTQVQRDLTATGSCAPVANTPTSTATATHTSTATSTATHTPTPTATSTPTLTPTGTPTSTATGTSTTTPTASSTPTPTWTATNTRTSTSTPTYTATATATSTQTSTSTPTATPSSTPSFTPIATSSSTPTVTPTWTLTPTASPSVTPTRPQRLFLPMLFR